MLRSLHIENMAVIRDLELEPCAGLTVLTGETGAGKSVIVDAINFLLGRPVPRDIIRSGEDRASVSGVFSVDGQAAERLTELGVALADGEIMLERVQNSDGRTVCRVNGRTVTRQLLRDCGEALVSVHGQKDTGALDSSGSGTAMLDAAAGDSAELAAYVSAYKAWSSVRSKLAGLRRSDAENERLRDMLQFQIGEIAAAGLRPGEEERLQTERRRLRNLEKINRQTGIALRAVYKNDKGITAPFLADRAADALEKIAGDLPEFAPVCEKLRECRYQLEEAASELNALAEACGSMSPEQAARELDRTEDRLETISRLKRKYGADEAAVLAFREEAERRLSEIEGAGELLTSLTEEESRLRAAVDAAASELSSVRRAAAGRLRSDVLAALEYLDMPKVRFDVTVEPLSEPGPDGADCVGFMLSANPGEPMLPLSGCASGGELSRVMLALKCSIAGSYGIPTLVFDEIDTGISGKTSRKIGRKLHEAASASQIICVTHSAQIASLADTHILISKTQRGDRTETAASVLDGEGRIAENARILGGINVTEAQRRAAEDLLRKTEE
jgi:DNA repair protein RecN (Recombination protein N)